MALPKLEQLITVPTGGWTFVLTESTGYAGNVTIPAGDYFLTSVAAGGTRSLLGELAHRMDVAGRFYTATVDDDADSSLGKVTLRQGSSGVGFTFAIAWTDTALRDALGFTGNISGTYTYTTTTHARYLWLPNCGRSGDHPEPAVGQSNFGRPVRDTTRTVAPSGVSSAYFYNTRYTSRLRFGTLLGRKVWQGLEVTPNESFERFWLDGFGSGSRFRYHPDRASNSAYWTLIPVNPGQFPTQEMDPAHFSDVSIHEIQFETLDYVS